MAKANLGDVIGGWAFLLGVVLAVIVGLFSIVNPTVTLVLAAIGLIVGFLNIGDKEVTQFLFSGLVLVLISSAGINYMTNPYVNVGGILTALLVIFVPATVVVAVKNVFSLARR